MKYTTKGTKLGLVCFVAFSPYLPEKGHHQFRFLSRIGRICRKQGFMDAQRRFCLTDVVRHLELLNLEHGFAKQIEN